ncbi:MAG: TasA family protein, partial [Ignavibacteria bacterium]|nr:TasA family protein [Ignavibacteria bacterium]
MRTSYLVLFFFLLSFSLYSFDVERISGTDYQGDNPDKSRKEINKPNTNESNNFIAINQIFMWVSNNGMGSHDPRTDGSGFYWPGGENATISAIFEDGLIWGAKVDTQIRVNGSVYRHGLQAGKILPNGEADNPNLEKYRIYKIRKGWESLPPGPRRDTYEKDYHEWPIEDGAPYVLDKEGNKVPNFVGDEVLWCVSNDMDQTRSTYTYGTLPMGLEQQMTVFGFNRSGDLGDMVFKKYKLINKGNLTLREVYLAYWSDTDLGDASDDYTGCDTTLKLGYTYNGDNNDENYYGTTPPAVGYVFFQGPMVEGAATDSAKFLSVWRHGYKNLPMTAFTFFINSDATGRFLDPDQGVAAGSVQFYNNMTGKSKTGVQFVDPNTGISTNIILAGDPVAGTGWYEGYVGWPGGPGPPYDRRHLMSSGPFTMAPGDTQEVVIGIVIARGSNNLNSITELKKKTKIAQTAYDKDFSSMQPPLDPIVTSVVDDKQVTFHWEPNTEDYDVVDPFITGKGKADTTYTFEGYRIWQFEDELGRNPKLLKIFDIKNNVTKVTQILDFNGVKVEQTIFEMPNQGIARFFSTNFDKINYTPLINGTSYYFGVTAFGYSKDSDPQYLENPVKIIKVVPEKIGFDSSFTYRYGSYIDAKQTAGVEDGNVRLFVVNPLELTGDTYKVTFDSTIIRNFNNTADTLALTFNLLNISKTPVDTLLRTRTEFGTDVSTNKYIFDGFSLVVRNTGLDSLPKVNSKYKVKSVEEIK